VKVPIGIVLAFVLFLFPLTAWAFHDGEDEELPLRWPPAIPRSLPPPTPGIPLPWSATPAQPTPPPSWHCSEVGTSTNCMTDLRNGGRPLHWHCLTLNGQTSCQIDLRDR
jgi:hypothetical protein